MRGRKKSQQQQTKVDSEKNTQTPLAPNQQTGGNGQMPLNIHPLLLGATAAALHSSKQEDVEQDTSQHKQQFVYMHDIPMLSSKDDREDNDKTGNPASTKNVDDSTTAVLNSNKNITSEKTAPVLKAIRDPYVDIGSKDPADGDKLEQSNRHSVTSKNENDKETAKEDNKEEGTKSDASAEHKNNKNDAEFKSNHKEEGSGEDKDQSEKTNNSFDSKDEEKSSEDQKSDAKEVTEKLEKTETTTNEENKQNKFNKEESSSSNVEAADSSSAAMVSLLKNQASQKQHHDNDKLESGDSKVDADTSSNLIDKILEKDKEYTSKLTSDLHQQLSSSSDDEDTDKGSKGDDNSSSHDDREVNKDDSSGDDKMTVMLGKVDKAMNNGQNKDKEDDDIKKLIHHIKEKLAAKSIKKHKDVYAEIGTPGKRDKNGRHTIGQKSLLNNKNHKH